jgi:hypothetical protein
MCDSVGQTTTDRQTGGRSANWLPTFLSSLSNRPAIPAGPTFPLFFFLFSSPGRGTMDGRSWPGAMRAAREPDKRAAKPAAMQGKPEARAERMEGAAESARPRGGAGDKVVWRARGGASSGYPGRGSRTGRDWRSNQRGARRGSRQECDSRRRPEDQAQGCTKAQQDGDGAEASVLFARDAPPSRACRCCFGRWGHRVLEMGVGGVATCGDPGRVRTRGGEARCRSGMRGRRGCRGRCRGARERKGSRLKML